MKPSDVNLHYEKDTHEKGQEKWIDCSMDNMVEMLLPRYCPGTTFSGSDSQKQQHSVPETMVDGAQFGQRADEKRNVGYIIPVHQIHGAEQRQDHPIFYL